MNLVDPGGVTDNMCLSREFLGDTPDLLGPTMWLVGAVGVLNALLNPEGVRGNVLDPPGVSGATPDLGDLTTSS